MIRLRLCLTAVLLAVMSSAASAQNIATIRLDNYPNGGTINYTGTSDTITVQVKYCGGPYNWVTVGTPRSLTSVSGQHDFTWVETNTTSAWHVTDIRVLIDGPDWFWLDQIELFNSQGQLEFYDGVDNMNGYCLSTQDSDGSNAVCYPNNWPTNDTSNPSKSWKVQSQICGWQ